MATKKFLEMVSGGRVRTKARVTYRDHLMKMPLEQVQERARGGDFNAKTELFRRQRTGIAS